MKVRWCHRVNWFCTTIGKLFACFVLSSFIYFSILGVYKMSNNKVISENEQNKGKSLLTFIDRWKYSLYNGLRDIRIYSKIRSLVIIIKRKI